VLDDELVFSARCVVWVDGDVVVCTNAHLGRHPLPGGRREDGETAARTAMREVHEETGWLLAPDTLQAIGWLRFRYLEPTAPEWRHKPHPDMVHVVFSADAVERDASQGGDWSDTEGFETSSELLAPAAALQVIESPLDRAMLELAIAARVTAP
jgi:8-oxo-dGTP pyrophosphatase MutT (NUDIX family)